MWVPIRCWWLQEWRRRHTPKARSLFAWCSPSFTNSPFALPHPPHASIHASSISAPRKWKHTHACPPPISPSPTIVHLRLPHSPQTTISGIGAPVLSPPCPLIRDASAGGYENALEKVGVRRGMERGRRVDKEEGRVALKQQENSGHHHHHLKLQSLNSDHSKTIAATSQRNTKMPTSP
ncbi:hypothetical protein BDQ12DRAFT_59507 [Crucibulum laeve]|uniref:Uncharacterized protein n=1 Tax=Crucibulum laeve TaxID=68775 RepID=A0A5C3M6P5_9AGAR|nr:hypothetical protein BDQ12DRAFT_59507 [Crucibulum laeve]